MASIRNSVSQEELSSLLQLRDSLLRQENRRRPSQMRQNAPGSPRRASRRPPR